MSTDHDQLVAEALAGTDGALNALLVLISEKLRAELKHRRLQGMSPSRSAADFVQDTLIRVHEHFAGFPGTTFNELTRWSWRILYRRHQETRRNRRVRSSEQMAWKIWSAVSLKKSLPGQERPRKSDEDELERQEGAERVFRLFQSSLKPHERNVIQLRLLEGLPYETIAASVNRSSEAVRKEYHRAIDRLRILFDSNGRL